MNTLNNIKKIASREERNTYQGVYKDFQTFGSNYKGKRYTEYEVHKYNPFQNFLYKRAINGLKMYEPKEIKRMHPKKKKRILTTYKRTQRVISILKQDRIIEMTNKIFGLFTNSSTAKDLIELYSEPQSDFVSSISLKDVGISKDIIIDKLIEERLLPEAFHTIENKQ
jgi:hypothetical protein